MDQGIYHPDKAGVSTGRRNPYGGDTYLSRVVATLEGTEGAIDRVEPVVERGTLNEVSRLEEQDGLRVGETERVL